MMLGWNGEVVSDQEAAISVYDHGFLYGIGLFESFRTYNGNAFLLEEHMLRLQNSCVELSIQYRPCMWLDRIDRHIRALLAANELEDGYIRFSVSAGIGQVGLPAGAYDDPNVIVYVKPLPPYDERTDKYGRGLQLLQTRRNSPESGVRMKSFHYMNNIVAKRELQRYPWAGQAEGLMLNAAGFIAEGIVSNLFFIKDQVLFTPAVETGILPGVTRRYVMQICEQQGILVIEGEFEWEELLDADELFYTNSIQEIVPVTRLFDNEGNMHTVGDGCCGGQTALLLNHYRKAAEEQQ